MRCNRIEKGPSRTEGYLGDERFAGTGTGDRVATWSFGGVTPGWYRVAVTWIPGANRASDAQFQVFNGDSPALASPTGDLGRLVAGAAQIDQRMSPASFADDGAPWQELASPGNPDQELYLWVTGHQLVVTLPGTGDQYVMAEAVRIERIVTVEADIRVLEGDGLNVTSGHWLTNLGTTYTDGSTSQTFTIQNVGLAAMTVAVDTSQLPDAYDVSPSQLALNPGDEQILTVTLQSTAPGRYAGSLLLNVPEDRDENLFKFGLTGLVRSATPIAATDVVVVDDEADPTGETEFEVRGNFRDMRRDTLNVTRAVWQQKAVTWAGSKHGRQVPPASAEAACRRAWVKPPHSLRVSHGNPPARPKTRYSRGSRTVSREPGGATIGKRAAKKANLS
jgi:hypothetical protein